MRALFAPSIKLMNGLGYTKKFAVMGVLALVAIGFVLVNLVTHLDRVITHSRNELAGIEVMKPMSKLVQRLQQHRGLSAGAIHGDAKMKEARPLREKDVSGELQIIDGLMAAELTGSPAWKKFQSDWEKLRSGGLAMSVPENIAEHSRLIDDLLVFQSLVADHYMLSSDPQMNSIYMIDMAISKLPLVIERLGQLRAIGSGVLVDQQLQEHHENKLRSLLSELAWGQKINRISLEKTLRYNPELKEALGGAAKELDALSEQIGKTVIEDIFLRTFSISAADYFTLTSKASDNGYRPR